MGACRVVHCKKEPFDVMIDRSTKWGNPFTHLKGSSRGKYIVDTREEAIEAYEEWILSEEGQHLLEDLHELEGKVLGCWCKPKSCHGDYLVRLVNTRNQVHYNEVGGSLFVTIGDNLGSFEVSRSSLGNILVSDAKGYSTAKQQWDAIEYYKISSCNIR